MIIETKVDESILVVRLEGELDHHTVEGLRADLEAQLQDADCNGLVMSFRNIAFMDSSGLGLILGRYRTVTERGGRMALCEVNDTLARLFEMSGLFKIMPLFTSEDAAITFLKEVL